MYALRKRFYFWQVWNRLERKRQVGSFNFVQIFLEGFGFPFSHFFWPLNSFFSRHILTGSYSNFFRTFKRGADPNLAKTYEVRQLVLIFLGYFFVGFAFYSFAAVFRFTEHFLLKKLNFLRLTLKNLERVCAHAESWLRVIHVGTRNVYKHLQIRLRRKLEQML